jgi:succinoglycan biosynthesis transport protein ExoP
MTDEAFRALALYATQLRLDQESPKRVSVLQTASNPTQKETKKQIIGTVFAGLMGFVLVALGAVGYEVRVKKVSSLSDLQTATPTPVVGVIPWQPDGAADLDSERKAEINESVDKLRSYVSQTWLARGATTVAVTSPLGDEGKAYTAVGLAGSLAAAGFKTLLVDFDLRSPSLHTLTGVANEAGACELLRGEADLRQTIHALPSGLHFLPAGKWSDAARLAAVGGRLESLLARLREPFDCVVIHSHALLTAAESVEIARRCEVVLLCALCRDTRTTLLKRATERVAKMEVPYSGIVYLGSTPQEALC